MWQYIAYGFFLSQDYNLRQQLMLRCLHNDDIRNTRHGKLVSPRCKYPDFDLYRTCRKMDYMWHLIPGPGESLCRTFRRDGEEYDKGAVP